MTNLVAGNEAVDLTSWAFEPGWHGTSHSATEFTIEQEGTTKVDTFTGFGFGGYDSNGFPTLGTITGLSFAENGDTQVTLSDFSMTVADERHFSGNQDMAGFQGALFGGDDSFSDSPQGDHFFGLSGNDTFNMTHGGDDIAEGDDGDDTFNFGAAFSANDTVDGGAGFDTLSLDGNYSAGVTFNAATISNVESIELGGGHSYSLILDNGNVAAGAPLTVDGSALHSANMLDFDGSQEKNGHFNVVGGAGDDSLTGGALGDTLRGGGGGNDTLVGGGGDDLLVSDAGQTAMSGGKGNDTFVINGGGQVFTDVVSGGAAAGSDVIHIDDTRGIDTIDMRGALSGATIDLSSGGTVAGRTVVIGNGEGGSAQPLDLVFAQDLTGSFGDDLTNVSAFLPDIFDAVHAVESNARFGVTSFKDKPWDGSSDYSYETDVSLTTHTHAIQAAYAGFSASGGEDFPEDPLEALQQMGLREGQVGWASGSLHLVVLFTDATFHFAGDGTAAANGVDTPNNGDTVLDGTPPGTGEDYPDIGQVRDALLAEDIVPVFAVTSDVFSTYQDLVTQLGFGTVVELASDSSNVVDAVNSALDFVSNPTVIENIQGTEFADTITGNAAANTIWGNRGSDTLDGGDGKDVIYGGDGRDTLYGGSGGDRFDGGEGNDHITGGGGRDTVSYAHAGGGMNVDLQAGTSSGPDGADTLSSIENVVGSGFGDTIAGNSISNTLTGGAGNDVMYGGAGGAPASAIFATVNHNLVNGLGGSAGFGESNLPANDDGSTGAIDITSVFGAEGLNFFGTDYTSLFVNNNGNITFASASGQFTPDVISAGAGNPIIAAFWADVDTNNPIGTTSPGGNSTGSDLVWYDLDTVNHVFTVTWDDVGYYGAHDDLVDAFQLQLIDEGNGDFDIIFRYEAVNWTTGDASGGSGGLGGTPARAGYSAGDGVNYFELPESGNQSQMLGLPDTTGNTGTAGVFEFQVRNGQVVGADDDTLDGGLGSDTLYGGDGNDVLRGGANSDALYGGNGDDLLAGGDGQDILSGDAGADTFQFDLTGAALAATDTIVGFDPTEDKIDTAVHVTAVEAPISGRGSLESLAADLGAHHAVIVTKAHGGGADALAGASSHHNVFLIVDVNGVTGFQSGEDLVIRLDGGVNLDSLDTGSFI
jgi:Ca2+-binding RTX toxin-like protein